VLVASGGQAFKLPLEEIARDGVPVQVLGFREHASWALASDTLEFVDLEDIPGVLRETRLRRIGLIRLPSRGLGCRPFAPLSYATDPRACRQLETRVAQTLGRS